MEERDDSVYKTLPLGLRILLRTIIVLFKLALPWLRQYNMTGYLAIDSIDEFEYEFGYDDDDDEDEEIVH
jgi:hypothetical protein